MTDLRKAAEMALEALEANLGKWAAKTKAVEALRQALAQPEREWVGLTGNEARDFYEKYTDREELIYAIDKFLEEKNGG